MVIDIDDTVANLRDAFCAAVHEHTGIWKHWSDWKTTRLSVEYPGLPMSTLSILVHQGILERLLPDGDGWSEVFHYAYSKFRVSVLTSRGYHPKGQELTENWLQRHNMPYHEVILAENSNSSKSDVLRQKGIMPVWMVDDNPDVLEDCLAYCPHGLIRMLRPYNRHVQNVPWHASCASDVLEIISAN